MKFHGKSNEILFISSISLENEHLYENNLRTGLSVIWNTDDMAGLIVDGKKIELKKNCVLFLTEFHRLDQLIFKTLNVIQFNKEFYCLEKHDDEVGCRGMLFFGASDIPKIQIPKDKIKQFNLLWEIFLMEMDESDSLKKEMLRVMLKRFLITCLRIYKTEKHDVPVDRNNIGIVREFNYLVEKHFKSLSTVKEYSRLLHKSPKTISNIFKKYIDRTPLQIINDRRLLEARRLLDYTDAPVQEISDELNFKDVQSFSHFFSHREGIPPTSFRQRIKEPASSE